jgi:hypothetical protein
MRSMVVGISFVVGAAWQGPAMADKTGAFLGGMVTAKVLSNMSRRTQAEEAQAYYASQPASQPQPVQQYQAPPAQTAEQKLQQLDKLAAGGYITPEEYKAKKQQILDNM